MREVDARAGLVLVECGDAVAEEVLDVCARVLVHHPCQVFAQHLDVFAVEQAAHAGGADSPVRTRHRPGASAHRYQRAHARALGEQALHDLVTTLYQPLPRPLSATLSAGVPRALTSGPDPPSDRTTHRVLLLPRPFGPSGGS
ncbi:hypothetical protein [Streptomyces globisporus]|uniref:hypothetical protein n=1 Tax=Streptomyces globisporus TaxID=1908 RepID=UPI000A733709|nr:hypothetical protein [Streptomyces globisporus]